MAPRSKLRQAQHSSPRIFPPVRREKPAECRNEIAPSVVLRGLDQAIDFLGVVDQAEVVLPPVYCGTCRRNRAFEGVDCG